MEKALISYLDNLNSSSKGHVTEYILYGESDKQLYIDNKTSLKKIYELFITDTPFDPTTAIELHYMGFYFEMTKNYGLMEKYYLMAFNQDYLPSLYKLVEHFYSKQNYDNVIKYYELAIDKGNSDAMISLGDYYRNHCHDKEQAKQLYLKAVETDNNVKAMYKLISHYKKTPCCDKVMKYYLMVFATGDFSKINNFVKYCERYRMIFALLRLCILYPNKIQGTSIPETIEFLLAGHYHMRDRPEYIRLITQFLSSTENNLNIVFLLNLKNIMII